MKRNFTTVPRDNLVGEYLLDGDALDTSGNGNNGTATNVSYLTAERGYVNQVGSFNGSSSNFTLPTGTIGTELDGTSGYTFNIWIKNNSFPTVAVLHQSFVNSNQYGTYIDIQSNNSIRFFGRSQGGDAAGGHTITGFTTIGERTMLTGVYNISGDTVSGYVNGKLDGSTGVSWNSNTYNLGTPTLNDYFGSNSSPSNFFNGNIGLVRIYDRILSQDEINNLYQEGLRRLGPTNAIQNSGAGVYSLPNLEDGKILEISKAVSSGTYYDQSGNGNNGTSSNIVDGTQGKLNSMRFNGSNSVINLSDLGIGSGDITINMWFRVPVNDNNRHELFAIHDTGAFSNKLEFYIGNDSENDSLIGVFRDGTSGEAKLQGNISYKDNKYYMATIERTGTSSKIYINSVEISSLTNSEIGVNLGGKYELGAFNTGSIFNPLDGSICFPVVYNRILSTEEKEQLYYGQKGNFI